MWLGDCPSVLGAAGILRESGTLAEVLDACSSSPRRKDVDMDLGL